VTSTREVTIRNRLGLHARAAARFVHTANRFRARITLTGQGKTMDGKSILGILLLAAGRGSTITLKAAGEDERDALDAVEKLIDAKFDEVE
jgi:phosphocarrier protein